MTSAQSDDSPTISSLTDLSLDELRFLRSCDKHWFELSPAKAQAIIKAARHLISDLIHEDGKIPDPSARSDRPDERKMKHQDG